MCFVLLLLYTKAVKTSIKFLSGTHIFTQFVLQENKGIWFLETGHNFLFLHLSRALHIIAEANIHETAVFNTLHITSWLIKLQKFNSKVFLHHVHTVVYSGLSGLLDSVFFFILAHIFRQLIVATAMYGMA